MDIMLKIVKGGGSHKDFPVKKSRVVIGRTEACDLRVPLPNVSRKHCELNIAGGKVSLRDMGSSNGTFVNGKRVQECVLSAGDEISVGTLSFRLLINGQPADDKANKSVNKPAPVQSSAAAKSVAAAKPGKPVPPKGKTGTARKAPSADELVDIIDSADDDGHHDLAALAAAGEGDDETPIILEEEEPAPAKTKKQDPPTKKTN